MKKNSSNRILRKNLNQDQLSLFESAKKLSEHLIAFHFNRNSKFKEIRKTNDGFTVIRTCFVYGKNLCNWNIKINIVTNLVTITCNCDCRHFIGKINRSIYNLL